jgi:hypothetical protein
MENDGMNEITPGQTLSARSVCNHDCIFSVKVLARSARMATIEEFGKVKRTKVHRDEQGEYLRPDSYSMAPIFRA